MKPKVPNKTSRKSNKRHTNLGTFEKPFSSKNNLWPIDYEKKIKKAKKFTKSNQKNIFIFTHRGRKKKCKFCFSFSSFTAHVSAILLQRLKNTEITPKNTRKTRENRTHIWYIIYSTSQIPLTRYPKKNPDEQMRNCCHLGLSESEIPNKLRACSSFFIIS